VSEPSQPPRGWRAINVVATASVAIAVVGLVSGVEGTRATPRPPPASERRDPPETPPVTGSRSYRDMQARDWGPNGELPAAWFEGIRRAPDPSAPAAPTDAQREAALAQRALRRAYDGAPPTIPHAVDPRGAPACLACHETGVRVASLVAPMMSHARRDNCLQCHVVAGDPRPVAITPPAPETTFAGLRPSRGQRAWAGAPPTIPHATAMRERCESCHGPRGPQGLRTTHPWRAPCQQCHAPSAALDQRAPDPKGAP